MFPELELSDNDSNRIASAFYNGWTQLGGWSCRSSSPIVFTSFLSLGVSGFLLGGCVTISNSFCIPKALHSTTSLLSYMLACATCGDKCETITCTQQTTQWNCASNTCTMEHYYALLKHIIHHDCGCRIAHSLWLSWCVQV